MTATVRVLRARARVSVQAALSIEVAGVVMAVAGTSEGGRARVPE